MNTSAPTSEIQVPLTSSEIILIVTTIFTGVVSLLDLVVNSYVAHKKRHFTSSCCKGFCDMEYNSEEPNTSLKEMQEVKVSPPLKKGNV